ncbi:MAG: HEAT repeat domain-containing protein [Armatimonadota bacterium]
MSIRLVSLVLCVLLLALPTITRSQVANADKTRIANLISQLKSADNTVRNTAIEELEVIGTAAIPALLKVASHPDVRVRRGVIRLIGRIQDARSQPYLVAALRDADAEVVNTALDGLYGARDPRLLPALFTLMRRPDWGQFDNRALLLLQSVAWRLPDDQALAALQDPAPGVRKIGACALETSFDPRAVPALQGVLRDPALTWFAILGLMRYRTPEMAPRLRELLTSKDHADRAGAMYQLGLLRDPEAVPLMLEALNDPSPIEQLPALCALIRYRDPRAVPAVRRMLKDEDESIRSNALRLLNVARTPEADALLLEAYRAEQDPEAGIDIALMLLLHGNREIVEELLARTKSADAGQRAFAYLALTQVREPRVLDLFLAALADPELRNIGILGQEMLKDPRAVDPLIALLKDDELRPHVCQSLAAIGDKRAVAPIIASLASQGQTTYNPDDTIKALDSLCGDDVETLASALKAGRYDHELADVLARRKDRRAVPFLIEALLTYRQPVNGMLRHGTGEGSLARALGDLGDPRAIPILGEIYQDYESEAQGPAGYALAEIGGPEVAPILMTQLHHRDPWVRGLAVKTLGALKDPRGLPPILAALQDKTPLVRYDAALALGAFGDPSAVPALIALLNDTALVKDQDFYYRSDPQVAEAAVIALGYLRDPRIFDLLAARLSAKDPYMRSSALESLIVQRDPRAVPLLGTALRDAELGDIAARALGEWGDPRAVEPLLAALKDAVVPSSEMIAALGKLKDPRAVELLIQLLRSWETARYAIPALVEIGDPRAIEPLILTLRNGPGFPREVAAEALGTFKDLRAVPVLIEALSGETEAIRESAATALAQLGNRQAIGPLVNGLACAESHAEAAAFAEALKTLTGQDFGTDAEQWRAWWKGQ